MARYSIHHFVSWMRLLFKGTQQALLETAEAINVAMQEEGAPVDYPIKWDSELQKRAFFASNGFGEGIPYQRKGLYENSGTVTATPYGAQLFKPHPAGAIGGTSDGWQSAIHTGRWKYLPDVLEKELAKLPKRIRDHVVVSEGELDASS